MLESLDCVHFNELSLTYSFFCRITMSLKNTVMEIVSIQTICPAVRIFPVKHEKKHRFGVQRLLLLLPYNFSLCVLEDFVLMFYDLCFCRCILFFFPQTPDNKNAFVHFDASLTGVIEEKIN